MLPYGRDLEKILKRMETTVTPDFIKKDIEDSREQLKKILRRYPEVHRECTDAIEMAGKVITYDCTRSDYIRKVREILSVIT